MCGIAGFSQNTMGPNASQRLVQMLNNQAHRGPDGNGIHLSRTCGIGMLRLRMRADAQEAEPIMLPNNQFAAFNGEVYEDLSGQMPSGGRAEVEAILASHGSHAVNGMYALAVLDSPSDSIQLMRDPYGIKPLYTRTSDEGCFFSSEIGPLLQNGDTIKIRRSALLQFLAFGKPIDLGGFFHELQEVPPGGSITVSQGKAFENKANWSLASLLDNMEAESSSPADIRREIGESVKRCLESRYTTGVAVSGGLDSSIVCAELNAMNVRDLKLVSIRMQGAQDGIDDIQTLGLAGDAWKSWSLASRMVRPEGFMETLKQSVRIFGVPTRMSSLPLYLHLADLAQSEGITNLIIGEGADELFCGYESYQSFLQHRSLNRHIYKPSIQCELETLVARDFHGLIAESLRDFVAALPGRTDWEKMRLADFELSLRPLLTRVDHTLMFKTIEGRPAFLHGNIAKMALRLRPEDLMDEEHTKLILRKAYKGSLSANITHGPKVHFRAPIHVWFQSDLFDTLRDHLLGVASNFEDMGISRAALSDLLVKCKAGNDTAIDVSYRLLTTALWLEWLGEHGTVSVE